MQDEKGQAIERLLFGMLLIALAAAGFLYQRYRAEMPGWQLVGLVLAGICACYVAYRVVLTLLLRRLKR